MPRTGKPQRYGGSRWKRLAEEKLRASAFACERCGQGGGNPDNQLEVHHRHAVKDGGDPYPPLSGLEVLCRRCHFKHHDEERAEARFPPEWRALLARFEGGA